MSGGGEVLAYNFGQDACFCPDADRWYRRQDEVKRVGLQGSTVPAALVPTTTTVCSPKAVKISSAQRLPARGANLVKKVPTRVLPAVAKAAGVGYLRNSSAMALWSR